MADPGANIRRVVPPLPLLVFVVGASALGIEIAAVRLLAPYFGASTIVWANTIGVVLVALSIGYWLGGRWADRRPDIGSLCTVVLAAGVLTALLPFVAKPLLNAGVDALESIEAGAFVGSMLATLVLVALPVLLLGTVAPWALRIGITRVEDAGVLAGRLYAMSTLGSLGGTLVSALLLIPSVGTRRTFLIFAFATTVTAATGMVSARDAATWKRAGAGALPLVIALLFVMPAGAIKPRSADGRVIYETDTESQYARVVERTDGSRLLELNEGLAIHSLYRPESALTNNYWDAIQVLPYGSLDRAPRRVAVLGHAAGTVSRAFGRFHPATHVDGVEIDHELTAIGRRYFGLDNPRLRVFHEDARPYLRRVDTVYDAILVDAYRQPYIPFYLTTHEFFALARDRLTSDGMVVINVGHPRDSDRLERVLGATLRSVFRHVARSATEPTNTMLMASDRPIDPGAIRRAADTLDPQLARTAWREAGLVEPALAGGEVYTDDRAPVEWLIDRAIIDEGAGTD